MAARESALLRPAGLSPAPHASEAAEVVARLRSDADRGLSAGEAARRLALDGPNELAGGGGPSAWRILAGQFRNVLIAILLVAIALSLALGHVVEAAAIAVITAFSVVLGFIQEYRAERALEALRRMAAPNATVVRDGEELDVPSREVVAGDVILVEAGDLVPADGRVLSAANLRVDEAALTGESVPAGKETGVVAEELPLGDRRNLVFGSTAVVTGRARAVVTATGARSEVGRISELLKGVEQGPSPLEAALGRVGRQLARAAVGVVAVVVALGLLRGLPLVEMIIFGIALAVAVVPEALPAVVTVSLAIGAQRMARRRALIRRLPTVETLGSTTVICSDKTGTLTAGEMTVRELYAGGRTIAVSGAGYAPEGGFSGEAPRGLLAAAALCNDAHLLRDAEGRWRVKGDPTEGALLVAAAKAGLKRAALESELPRTDEIAFTPERKRMTTMHRGAVAISKGAPEVIVASCEMGEEERGRVLAEARSMAGRALRVLAVARRDGAAIESAESGMTFLGLVGMIDPPRPEAREAIRTCRDAGIRPVMITGDHPMTARAVGAEIGLEGELLTGRELEAMDDEALRGRVAATSIYARVSPADKLRVVAALQSRGEVVAMTGDGVNDAPALKKADIGVAMGVTGTDVAKEAAAMTLTDDNFATIVAAVEEGRAIFDNIKKYVMYLVSSNIGEIALMAGAMVAGLPLPLSAVQILYVNLATDGLPALALAVDPPSRELMRRKPKARGGGIFPRPVVVLMLLGGAWSALVNLSLFAWALSSGRSLAHAMTMAFVSLVLIQFFKAYAFRSELRSTFARPFENRWLNLAVAWEVLLLVLIVTVPALRGVFGAAALSVTDGVIVTAGAFSVVPVLEGAKWACAIRKI
jgi:Ca2+-transporting ATPase